MRLFACTYIEIEIQTSGVLARAEPDVGVMVDGVEDFTIEGVRGMRKVYTGGKWEDKYFDLFAGLDKKAKAALENNLWRCLDEDAVVGEMMANQDA